ncbi:MAG: SGNH/GDSL hydrolase family protein [Bacteroidetes bacterium]|nr:SGNH/GDSL hydrolase family protein [Bacteroidota bacterium]
MSTHIYNYLALGDSYTIGESVPLFESFPYQLVQMLRKNKCSFHAPEIIAKTGFTTFELAEQILQTKLETHYDFATLLIGVNNQYRNLPLEAYEKDFSFLLQKAIHYCNGQNQHVFVLSIPDWGLTPFAKDRDIKKISEEINLFNQIAQLICTKNNVCFLDITTQMRTTSNDPGYLANDGLHYSAKMYAEWALLISEKILKIIPH